MVRTVIGYDCRLKEARHITQGTSKIKIALKDGAQSAKRATRDPEKAGGTVSQ